MGTEYSMVSTKRPGLNFPQKHIFQKRTILLRALVHENQENLKRLYEKTISSL